MRVERGEEGGGRKETNGSWGRERGECERRGGGGEGSESDCAAALGTSNQTCHMPRRRAGRAGRGASARGRAPPNDGRGGRGRREGKKGGGTRGRERAWRVARAHALVSAQARKPTERRRARREAREEGAAGGRRDAASGAGWAGGLAGNETGTRRGRGQVWGGGGGGRGGWDVRNAPHRREEEKKEKETARESREGERARGSDGTETKGGRIVVGGKQPARKTLCLKSVLGAARVRRLPLVTASFAL